MFSHNTGATQCPALNAQWAKSESGIAVVMALIALAIFSTIGMYMTLNATTEMRISDNYESQVEASYAANAGLNHTREVLRGMRWDDLLKGPDGTYTNTGAYRNQARAFAFRNMLSWNAARSMDILNPASAIASLPDDGLINTGLYGATPGTVIIPMAGLSFTAPNPYGSGTIMTGRYFVKVSDNNSEASELSGDPSDNPFFDGDNIIVVRSMGVARTIAEYGATVRRNSVAVVESRFKRSQTFNLNSPVVLEGNNPPVTFNGMPWAITGGPGGPGVGTIDTNTGDGFQPDQIVTAAAGGMGSITGGGLPNPSVADITAATAADPEAAALMDPVFLWDFVFNRLPMMADYMYTGDQVWAGGSAPYMGAYDHTLPYNDPSQDPKITYVNGNLTLSGNMTGGGLLVVTGDFICNARLIYDGLILVIGTGTFEAAGLNMGIWGGVFIADVSLVGGVPQLGESSFLMSGNSQIAYDASALTMAVELLAPETLSYRQITSNMDP